MNDQRIFNFGDSVYHALSISKQFAAEVDFQYLDSLLIDEFSDESIFDNTGNSSSGNREKGKSLFEEMDIEGKATSLDCYLYRAAMNLGLSSHGLEHIKDQIKTLEDISLDEYSFNVGSPHYESFIDIYANRDIDGLQKMTGEDLIEDFEMDKRNKIQATSFEKLSKIDKTFAVVGAAHLIGKNNVLEILERKGYLIRRIHFGQQTNKIDSLYALPSKEKWYRVDDPIFDASVSGNKIDFAV